MKKTVEMCFYRPAIHSYSLRNFGVAAALQQQINNLLLARTQPHWSRLIHGPPQLIHPYSIETRVRAKLCGASMNYM
jgi:hypothetical protein